MSAHHLIIDLLDGELPLKEYKVVRLNLILLALRL